MFFFFFNFRINLYGLLYSIRSWVKARVNRWFILILSILIILWNSFKSKFLYLLSIFLIVFNWRRWRKLFELDYGSLIKCLFSWIFRFLLSSVVYVLRSLFERLLLYCQIEFLFISLQEIWKNNSWLQKLSLIFHSFLLRPFLWFHLNLMLCCFVKLILKQVFIMRCIARKTRN